MWRKENSPVAKLLHIPLRLFLMPNGLLAYFGSLKHHVYMHVYMNTHTYIYDTGQQWQHWGWFAWSSVESSQSDWGTCLQSCFYQCFRWFTKRDVISQYLVKRLTVLGLRKWFLKIAKLTTFLFINLIRIWTFRTTKSPCGGDFECLGVWISEWGYCNEADFQGMTSQTFLKAGTWDIL